VVSKPFKSGKSVSGAARSRRLVGFERLESRELLSASSGVDVDDSTDIPATVVDGNSRQMEALNRGVIAMRRATSEIYVGWRMLGTDPASVSFNLYRSTNGGAAVKLNASPITNSTNYLDTSANTSVSNTYFVRPIIAGIELAASESFTLQASAPTRQYLNIPLQLPAGGTVPDHANPGQFLNYTYNANDASVGDLDGDGEYEIILKWDPSNSKDNSQAGYTGNHYVDAYKLDGTLMWRVDLGRNVRAGAHYLPFTVYDFDGDGKAEVIMRTAEATIDGGGNVVGNANADYRNSSGYVLSGPEYLSVFNGETGVIMDSAPFSPARGSVSSWGDSYGNRVDRFQQSVAYLDTDRPSLVIARGYAGPQGGFSARNEVAAFDYRDGELTFRWLFAAATNGANPGYVGQTAHSITVGDVDGDGRDEIMTGASALDDDGTLLYNTGLGHGDAMHLSDMIPSRPGLEYFMPHEGANSNGNIGFHVRDAATGELIFTVNSTGDVGRGVAADIDPNHPGYEYWATTSFTGETRSVYNSEGDAIYRTDAGTTNTTSDDIPFNFLVWWDDNFLREHLDGNTISTWRYDLATPRRETVLSLSGTSSNNGSKSTPALTGDLFGDWREEVMMRTSDNLNLRIYSTTIVTTNRLTTLMHDSQYRSAVSFQNSGYNQPAHPSFFLGAGMTTPAQPNIYTVSANPTIPGDFDLDGNVDEVDLGIWQQTYGMTQAQGYLPGDANGDGRVNGRDFTIWQRNFGQSQGSLAASTATSSALAAQDEFAQLLRDEAISQLAGISLPAALAIDDSSEVATLTEVDLYFESADSEASPVLSVKSTTSFPTFLTERENGIPGEELEFSFEVLESVWS
jgi:rhamnogalacturonan endolyase